MFTHEGDKPGAYASFPFDRELVRRFREAFPRARWRGAEERWFVPGTTAARRLQVWMSQELETLDRYADAKGRDAFTFDPLEVPTSPSRTTSASGHPIPGRSSTS